jgi:uncharacterized membrane protein
MPLASQICEGYTWINTPIIALFALLATYLVYLFFKKTKINFDKNILFGVLGLEAFSTAIRVLGPGDLDLLPYKCTGSIKALLTASFWQVSPGIFFLSGALGILVLYLFNKFNKKNGNLIFARTFLVLGLAGVLFVLSYMKNFGRILFGLLILAIVSLVVFLIAKYLLSKQIRMSFENTIAIFSQIFDASMTFVAINFFGFSEKHVLSGFVVSYLSPYFFLVIKIVLVLLLIYFIDKEVNQTYINKVMKLLIIIVGFGPGLRDLMILGI